MNYDVWEKFGRKANKKSKQVKGGIEGKGARDVKVIRSLTCYFYSVILVNHWIN